MTSFKNYIGRNLVISLYYLFRIFPIKGNKIYVKNFYGNGYGDSPKYIVSSILSNYPDYDIVWCVKGDKKLPKGIRSVDVSSYFGLVKSIFEQTTARVWIDNCRKYPFERKRKGQFYIQTWHGDMGLKKCEADAIDKIPLKEVLWSQHDSQMADLFICGTEWMRKRYREAYWYDGEIEVCGLPRRDILYTKDDFQIKNIKSSIGVDEKKNILLYVPTFRNEDISGNHLGGYVSQFNWESTLQAMEDRFGGKWVGLIRLHPNAAKYKSDLCLPDNVIDVTSYPDIMELLLVSDCCISDYSSCLFDFAVTKKRGFIFAPDIKEYESERGYYFTANDIPFPIATTMSELKEKIVRFDDAQYEKSHDIFYNEIVKISHDGEGHAAAYMANLINTMCQK